MNRLRFAAILTAAVFLVGCAAQHPSDADVKTAPKVKFKVEKRSGGQEYLVVRNLKNSKCKKFADKGSLRRGCIVAEHQQETNFPMRLSRSKHWYFTAFQICPTKETDKKPAPESWEADECELSSAQQQDWSVNTTHADGNGLIKIPNKVSEFVLKDLSQVPGLYFYRVKACTDNADGNPDRCLWTDPGGENKGHN